MVPPKRTFKNANVPNPVIKGKGKLEKIDFKELTEEVKRIWEGKPPAKLLEQWEQSGLKGEHSEKYWTVPSISSRFNSIKKLVGYNSNQVGFCSRCKNLNAFIQKQKIDGAIIITRFCTEHVPDKI